MNLTRDERPLLMLYYSFRCPEAIRILKEMQACLMPDETELWLMTESLIRKGLGVSQQAISAEAKMCSQGQSWPREQCLPACEVTNILSKRIWQSD